MKREIRQTGQREPGTTAEILRDIFYKGGTECRNREQIARHAALDSCINSEQARRDGREQDATAATREQDRNTDRAKQYAAAAEKLETLTAEYDTIIQSETGVI